MIQVLHPKPYVWRCVVTYICPITFNPSGFNPLIMCTHAFYEEKVPFDDRGYKYWTCSCYLHYLYTFYLRNGANYFLTVLVYFVMCGIVMAFTFVWVQCICFRMGLSHKGGLFISEGESLRSLEMTFPELHPWQDTCANIKVGESIHYATVVSKSTDSKVSEEPSYRHLVKGFS